MMVCGSYEKRFAPHRDYAQENVPGLRVVDLPAGHAVNAERHEEFNAAVAAFLRSGIGESHDAGHDSGPGPRHAAGSELRSRSLRPIIGSSG